MPGIIALAEALRSSTSLRKLSIGYNSIGQNAGRVLGDAAALSTITEIDLSGNLIGLPGGRAICEAVRLNAAMERVDLRFNSFDARHADPNHMGCGRVHHSPDVFQRCCVDARAIPLPPE